MPLLPRSRWLSKTVGSFTIAPIAVQNILRTNLLLQDVQNETGTKHSFRLSWELEKLKKQEEWIREWMIYAGRPGLYDDWLKFQSECKRQRAAELNKKRQKKVESDQFVATMAKWTGGIVLGMSIIFFGMWRVL